MKLCSRISIRGAAGLLLAALGAGCGRQAAPEPPAVPSAPSILVGTAELAAMLQDPKLRILDTRAADAFDSAHIPGAQRVDPNAWRTLAFAEGGLEDAALWSREIGRLGIDAGSRVVVYSDRVTDSARVWWHLQYAGVAGAALLDGGWTLWTEEGRPTTSATAAVAPVAFEAKLQSRRLARTEDVRAAVGDGSFTIVDSRSKAEFLGTQGRGRAGCIPGAAHLEWSELLGADGRFKPPPALRALFAERGIVDGKPLVPY